jgi:uncharacterized protein YdeI (BOF family)
MRKLMNPRPALLAVAIPATLAASSALVAQEPYAQPDNSWISISGTVVMPTSDEFTLDYGEGVITVEMDDWDAYGEAHALMDGDQVTVYGDIDDDLYEVASIEAAAVYVDSLNTYFYASSADEERIDYIPMHNWNVYVRPEPKQVTVTGTVSSVTREAREFTLDTGLRKLTVHTDDMAYNPLDDRGYQQVDRGDMVSVTGDLNRQFLEGRILDASFVTTMTRDRDS